MRDVLLSRVPVVFQAGISAVAALAGASVVVVGSLSHWPPQLIAVAECCRVLESE